MGVITAYKFMEYILLNQYYFGLIWSQPRMIVFPKKYFSNDFLTESMSFISLAENALKLECSLLSMMAP